MSTQAHVAGAATEAPPDGRRQRDPPGSIFMRFLKFGALAWGGPAAQIAMIKRECVDQQGWVSEETFKQTLAVYQVLPGPEAHELCVYFGRLRGGKLGGFLAGLGFMLPGFLLMLGLSVLYVEADIAALQVVHHRPHAGGHRCGRLRAHPPLLGELRARAAGGRARLRALD
jgi:chromate transporter